VFGRFLRRGKTPRGSPLAREAEITPAAPLAPDALATAVAHHQGGRFAEAERLYVQILGADPENFNALHLLGVIAHQRGEYARAAELISNAVEINPSSAEALSNLGECYRRLGRSTEAESCHRKALRLRPESYEAHYNLGILLAAQGDLAQAREAFQQAVRIQPRSAAAQCGLGNVLRRLGDAAAARARYEQAIALQPEFADAHSNLAGLLHDEGNLDAAAARYRQALAVKPDFAVGHFNLGNVLREQGRLQEAEACYTRALELNPELAAAHVNLGNLYREQGRLEDALLCYEQAARLPPAQAAVQLSLGDVLHLLQRYPEAQAAFEKALMLDPSSAAAAFGVGVVLVSLGRQAEAVTWFEKTLTLDPEMIAARWALVIAQLPAVYSNEAEVEARRASFAGRLSELEAWLGTRTVRDGDRAVGAMQPFLLAYQNELNRDLLGRCGKLCARLMADWRKSHPVGPTERPARKARLRIGIVSAQVCDHSVWNAIVKGWLAHLDRDRFDLCVFHLGARTDGETAYARSRALRFDQGPRTLEQWTDLLAEQQLDALLYPEVGMDTMNARLASLRLAPVQAASWGHPETTGLPTIDFYLSAQDLEPPGAQENYTERLVALPHLGCTCAAYRGEVSAPDRALFSAKPPAPVLLCPGTPFKYTPANDASLVEIARRLGRCRLVFFTYDRLPHLSERVRTRLAAAFDSAGLDPDQFIVFLPWQSRSGFYGLMQRADVYLDTIGFSGFNTALQALECTLPVVTREGRFLRSRLASGLLRRAGLSELVTASDEAYVEIAVRLARDTAYRSELRRRIATARGALFDDLAPVRALEAFLVDACGRG
jgi:predicted O-linked N-acetylglucosamine transferase (SPINDLY family)